MDKNDKKSQTTQNPQDIVDNTSNVPGEIVSDSASVLSTMETQKNVFVYNGN